jgi:hypothetical protein
MNTYGEDENLYKLSAVIFVSNMCFFLYPQDDQKSVEFTAKYCYNLMDVQRVPL